MNNKAAAIGSWVPTLKEQKLRTFYDWEVQKQKLKQ